MSNYKEECFKRLEYSNKYAKYSEEDLVDEIIEKDKEIERLNNIINELEKLIDSYELGKYDYSIPVAILKDKIKEGKTNE